MHWCSTRHEEEKCTHPASHNGLSADQHIVWPAPWSGNAIAVSGRGCGGLRAALARHILDTHFLRAINAERGWCARPHVCRARRRLAGGIGRQRKPWFPSITIPELGLPGDRVMVYAKL